MRKFFFLTKFFRDRSLPKKQETSLIHDALSLRIFSQLDMIEKFLKQFPENFYTKEYSSNVSTIGESTGDILDHFQYLDNALSQKFIDYSQRNKRLEAQESIRSALVYVEEIRKDLSVFAPMCWNEESVPVLIPIAKSGREIVTVTEKHSITTIVDNIANNTITNMKCITAKCGALGLGERILPRMWGDVGEHFSDKKFRLKNAS